MWVRILKVAAVVCLKVVSWDPPRKTGESKKYSLKITGNTAGIRSRYLQNINVDR
jgi:hypothetical protein